MIELLDRLNSDLNELVNKLGSKVLSDPGNHVAARTLQEVMRRAAMLRVDVIDLARLETLLGSRRKAEGD